MEGVWSLSVWLQEHQQAIPAYTDYNVILAMLASAPVLSVLYQE